MSGETIYMFFRFYEYLSGLNIICNYTHDQEIDEE